VLPLVQRKAPLHQAREHFVAARYSDCLRDLHGHHAPEAAILRCRVLLRMQRAAEAVEALDAFPPYADDSHGVKGTYYTLLGAACARAGLETRLDSALIEARAHVWSTSSISVNSEFEYYEATRAWMAGEMLVTTQHAQRALHREAPEVRVQALTLLAAVQARNGDYRGQVARLDEALHILATFAARDVGLEAGVLWNMAAPSADLHLVEVAERMASRAESLAWTSDIAKQHVQVLTELAWGRSLVGDHLRAFRLLRSAADVAPTPLWRLWAILHRAFLARELGERVMAAEEFDAAQNLADRIPWDETSGDERDCQRLLAELVAAVSPERAQRLLDRYRAIKTPMSPLFIATSDRRWRAEDCLAFGIVARAQGQLDRARTLLEEAFDIWSKINYVWRATRVAIELAEISDEPRFVNYAGSHIEQFPNSWLARRWRTSREEPSHE